MFSEIKFGRNKVAVLIINVEVYIVDGVSVAVAGNGGGLARL